MGKINEGLRSELKQIFGERVSFSNIERKLYSHDIAAIPGLIKALIGKPMADAVVQPQTEEEVVVIVRWASENNIAITPRGMASSGYGGVIPIKGGIVIDSHRLNAIKYIDPDKQTVTVEAGVIWENLDKELMKQGLTLRLYPTSYPVGTVGGFLAQGGAGIGSFEMGWFRDNVLSARAVMPDGEVREFIGDELDLIYAAEGITGFITEVTLLVQPLEELEVVAIGCHDAHNLQQMFQSIIEKKLPIWSLLFINPRMVELKYKTWSQIFINPHMEETQNKAHSLEPSEYAVEEETILHAPYITTIAFRKKDRDFVMDGLSEILNVCHAEMLSERIAQHEWKNRFNIMVIKRLGPSLVPAEVVIPLSELGNVMTEIENKVHQPVVKECIVIRESLNGQPEVVVLGFIPSDERRFSYNFVFGLVLTIMKIAEKHGGRSFSTGLYFPRIAKEVLGEKILTRIQDFKKKVDPRSILNPGKVVAGGIMGIAVSIAGVMEPLIRPLGNLVTTHLGERPTKSVRGIPADVAWYAYCCSQCGYCVNTCDQFYSRGWESQSPRGKWYWLREYMEGREEWDQFMLDTIISCTTCELCNLRCSASLPIESSWMKLRGKLINEDKKMTFPPFEMMAASLHKEGNIWAAYRKDRSQWFPEELKEKHGPSHKAKMAYYAGCTASHVENDIAMATVRLLAAAGVDFTCLGEKDNCCGAPMLVAGKWDIFEQTMRQNIQNMKDIGVNTVITSCPACDNMWRQVYPRWARQLGIDYNIDVRHYSEVIAEKIESGEFAFPNNGRKIRVTLHDSCHIGRVSSIYDAPRELVKAMPGVELVEMEHNREWAHCCGGVLTLMKEPEVAAIIGSARMNEAIETGADKLLSMCPCCEFQFRVTAGKENVPIETIDLAHFAASVLGYDFPDPEPEVQRQWAVFEAMIGLMTPQGFAELMETMWSELIDAMPLNMGKIMRAIGRMPGLLNLMKPMFPILFPTLLPLMIPKVMPVMLKRVEERIPMPDYMREQMPELMPKVVANLMPHMISDVVPMVTQPMIEYLRGNRRKSRY